ncbi:MAG: tetraacyldisaccharide 4'-kinase [Rhodoferax sp.]
MPGAMRPALQSALLRAWTRRGLLASVLWPLSLVFGALTALRRQLYRWGFLTTRRVDALVVVVGNVVAGGAGKTPTVITLVRHLQAQTYRVGVVSRGYGRQRSDCLEVLPHASPADVGDEPLLVHRSTGAPVFVGRTRHEAAAALLKQHPDIQIIVCDDGLQHYGLYRDLEICVFDDRGCGNGWRLPAGPLREGWPRQAVRTAGQHPEHLLVLHTGSRPAFAGYTAQRSLAPVAVRRDGTQVALTTWTTPDAPPLVAVAGIGQPESFFAMLRALGLPLVKTVALPDHYDFNSWSGNEYAGYTLICTEKDAAKLWPLAPDAVAVPLVLTAEPAFFSTLDTRIAALLAAKLSSTHGHKTS